jgi:hypothetical protein
MRRGILKSVVVTGLGLAVTTGVHAELLNISSNAMQSQNTPTAACTIVGRGGKTMADGRKLFVVLAEGKAADSNPSLVVKASDGSVVSNEDWTSTTIDFTGQPVWTDTAGWLGRSPGRESDAGTVVTALPGTWFCVTSREVSGGDVLRPVAVSVTDVTDKVGSAKSYAVGSDAGLHLDVLVGSPR